ncbi:hypothetical protein PI124_g13903 [Phytophthora idaei]|nr:hypothetical protein PI125_g13565 [Phytophthora idaei]KAG3147978.1 hypothetical protein PI126_g12643 [Phytophthora idaei]KAG3241224.1 hypothetical protein PI124_g13903 [Phytophthora idaei]
MAASAYQLWLKKREFKAPRQSPSPTAKSAASSSLAFSKTSASGGPSSFQAAHGLSEGISAKFHAVSGVETTQVAIRSVARPSAMRKRPRTSREKAADGEEPPHDHKVARRQEIRVDDPKVAGWKLQRSDKEGVMQTTVLKLTSTAAMLRQSSTRRHVERAVWSGRADVESKVAAGEKSDGKVATQIKSSLVKRQKLKGGSSVAIRAGQLSISIQQRGMAQRKRSIESAIGDNTAKRLRFGDDAEEIDQDVELSELPQKSPMKKLQRKLRTAMLDESQYWMAVDRFSHLT